MLTYSARVRYTRTGEIKERGNFGTAIEAGRQLARLMLLNGWTPGEESTAQRLAAGERIAHGKHVYYVEATGD